MTESADDEKPPRFPRWLRSWLLGGMAAFGLWALIAAAWWHAFGLKHEWLGAWGDSFAPLTGIASTLAVVFAVWAVHAQQEQLKLQRKELELQREELRLTRAVMAEQSKELAAQRAAQEESARQQASANRIANLANQISIEQAKLDVMDFSTRIDTYVQPVSTFSDDMLSSLEELRSRLERTSDSDDQCRK